VLKREIGLSEFDNCVLGELKGSLRMWGKCSRVEIEVRKWSDDSCEIGLRSDSMRWPVLTDRYAELASQSLEALVAELVLISVDNPNLDLPAPGRTSSIAPAQDGALALVS
jgi:hypothetical protein